nr:unnamed protein product [Callosobruchus chinensis]
MSEVTGISRTSIQRILKHYKWHPYKIQLLHELNEDDHDRRLQFFHRRAIRLIGDPDHTFQLQLLSHRRGGGVLLKNSFIKSHKGHTTIDE